MDRSITVKIQKELTGKKNKVIIIIGQRQVGKTYELKKILQNHPASLYFDFEDLTNRTIFKAAISTLESILGDKEKERFILFDEIQYLPNAGSVLKLIHDHFPKTKVVATGSASFLLLKNIGDSLYGRNVVFNMHPLTIREIVKDARNFQYVAGKYGKLIKKASIEADIDRIMLYGSLPEVYLENDPIQKQIILKNYISSLLFKDVLEIEGIRMPQVFKQLLKLLSLQLGSEVNPNELAQQLEINRKTVLEYISLYEKFRIIYTLTSYSSNLRREITRGLKVYFSDLGIRNAIINNYITVENRTDKGALFENLVINTFMQNRDYLDLSYEYFFWRTFTKAEVDLIIRDNQTDKLIPIEIKYNKFTKPSNSFFLKYNHRIDQYFSITKDNFWQFI